MKVKVREDAKMAYIGYMVHTCHSGYSNEWAATLEKVQGMTIEIETDHLFVDQFNTVPIPGVSDNGLRLMNRDVSEVIDDIRPLKMKCSWCGKTADIGDICPKCGKVEYLVKFKDKYLWTGKKGADHE